MVIAPDVSIRELRGLTVGVINAASMHWMPAFDEGQDWHEGAEVDAAGRAVVGNNGMIARTADAIVAIDPNAFTEHDAPATAELVLGSSFDIALDALGVTRLDVTHVVITHGHFDHLTGLLEPRDSTDLRFANAEHYFPAADRPAAGASGPYVAEIAHAIAALEDSGKLRLTEGDVAVASGVDILAAPGESAGHQVVRMTAGDEYVYYLGDLVHLAIEVAHPDWLPLPDRDLPALIKSRHRVFADPGGHPATFVFTHARFPAWGQITPTGPKSWVWQFA